jgi:dihydroorotase
VDAILEGLSDGTIDAIASDHARTTPTRKILEFDQAPFGIIGLETSVGLAFERLVRPGVISLERLVELCSTNPARILSLQDRGTLKSGARADVTILDPECAWTFDVSQSKSKSRNTPFNGYRFNGAAIATIVGGRVVSLHQARGTNQVIDCRGSRLGQPLKKILENQRSASGPTFC